MGLAAVLAGLAQHHELRRRELDATGRIARDEQGRAVGAEAEPRGVAHPQVGEHHLPAVGGPQALRHGIAVPHRMGELAADAVGLDGVELRAQALRGHPVAAPPRRIELWD